MQLEIATGFYQSESLPLVAQRCINWEPIVPQAAALNQRALRDVYGIDTRTLTGSAITGINRGAQVVSGVPYFINELSLYSFDADNVGTNHGVINGSGRVSLANNGRYLVIVVPGVTAYVFDNSDSSLAEITDINFQVSDTVTFKDGYFIFTATDGEQFFVSNLNQPLVFSALDFGSADVRPDKIIATHVNRNELFVCGEDTIELMQNIGGSGFPFQRVRGGDIQKGVHAKFSLVDFDNSFVFLGGDVNELTAVWRAGGGVTKISTSAVDKAIQDYTEDEIAEAFCFTYAYGGNYFLALTLESTRIPSRTLVYDATTSALTGQQTWHERQTGVVDDRWRVASLVSAYGDLIVADSIDGRIGTLNKDTHTEYSDPIFRQKTSMPFQIDQMHLFVSEMKLTMESGVGTIAGLDPQIGMEFSDDNARTFSTRYMRSYGKIGQYEKIPSWRRQGRVPRARVLRFTTTEPIRSHLLRLDAFGGQSAEI
ncbi:MAG: packaged DNA stabilization protein [Rhodospirillales bacterium]